MRSLSKKTYAKMFRKAVTTAIKKKEAHKLPRNVFSSRCPKRMENRAPLPKHNPRITQVQIADELDVPKSTVKYYVGKLSKSKTIKREGTVHNGKWIIL